MSIMAANIGFVSAEGRIVWASCHVSACLRQFDFFKARKQFHHIAGTTDTDTVDCNGVSASVLEKVLRLADTTKGEHSMDWGDDDVKPVWGFMESHSMAFELPDTLDSRRKITASFYDYINGAETLLNLQFCRYERILKNTMEKSGESHVINSFKVTADSLCNEIQAEKREDLFLRLAKDDIVMVCEPSVNQKTGQPCFHFRNAPQLSDSGHGGHGNANGLATKRSADYVAYYEYDLGLTLFHFLHVYASWFTLPYDYVEAYTRMEMRVCVRKGSIERNKREWELQARGKDMPNICKCEKAGEDYDILSVEGFSALGLYTVFALLEGVHVDRKLYNNNHNAVLKLKKPNPQVFFALIAGMRERRLFHMHYDITKNVFTVFGSVNSIGYICKKIYRNNGHILDAVPSTLFHIEICVNYKSWNMA